MASVDTFEDEQKRTAGFASPPQAAQPQPFTFDANSAFTPDLNPLAAQTGIERDALASQRDSYLQPLYQRYRQQATGPNHAPEDDATLFNSADFRRFTGAGSDAINAAQSGFPSASRDSYNIPSPGFQFTDPYTRQLEDTATQQMANLQQPQQNPALDQLMTFLGQRFGELTKTPGYSPDDLALMRTQALDPIEQDRTASNQRAVQRAASAGFLPTSGIAQLTASPTGGTETIDTSYDRMRAAAQRDLAVNAINKRNQDLTSAIGVGSLAGIQIPQQQRAEDQQRRSELMSLAQVLYNLPRQAMLDAQGLVNVTSSPNDVFQQALQTQQQQQIQQQQDAARWAAIAQTIAGMVF